MNALKVQLQVCYYLWNEEQRGRKTSKKNIQKFAVSGIHDNFTLAQKVGFAIVQPA